MIIAPGSNSTRGAPSRQSWARRRANGGAPFRSGSVGQSVKMRRVRAMPLGALLAGALAAASGRAEVLRVGTSGDYAPFSFGADPSGGDLEGFDIALAKAYAKARGFGVRFVPFRWPESNRALLSNRFDARDRRCDQRTLETASTREVGA